MKQTGILVTGDFYGGRRVSEIIKKNSYGELFGAFKNIIDKSELSITNLESPTLNQGKPIAKSGPAIKAVPETIDALKFAGFDLVTLANNHILDFGDEGLLSTFKNLESRKIDYVGAGKNLEEARSIYYRNVQNRKVAIINFCENEWSTTTGKYPGANPLNLVNNYYDIQKAKGNADKVVVIFHGGNELFSLPSPQMKERCRYFVDVGADVVIVHHAHYYSGYESYNKGLIFYGLGNFIFDNQNFKNPLWNLGLAVQLNFTEKDDINFAIIPFKQCDSKLGVELLEEPSSHKIFAHLDELNTIISDDQLLKIEYEKFCKKVESQYLGQIQPYSNKYLYAAFKRGYLPSLFNRNKYNLIQNLTRCESHRETLIKILDKRNK